MVKKQSTIHQLKWKVKKKFKKGKRHGKNKINKLQQKKYVCKIKFYSSGLIHFLIIFEIHLTLNYIKMKVL